MCAPPTKCGPSIMLLNQTYNAHFVSKLGYTVLPDPVLIVKLSKKKPWTLYLNCGDEIFLYLYLCPLTFDSKNIFPLKISPPILIGLLNSIEESA